MKLVSWNINGIRAAAKRGFAEWLGSASPEILCLQETKAHPEDVKVEVLPPRPMTEGSRMMEIELRITVPPWEQLTNQGGQVEVFTNQTDPEFKRLVVSITKRPPTPKGRPRHPVLPPPATQPKP